MISQGNPPPGVSAAAWAAYLDNLGGGGGGSAGNGYGQDYSAGGDPGYFFGPGDAPPADPSMPSGAAEWWAQQGGDGGYPTGNGYYNTGGGMGYIHGTPGDETSAWNLFLEMKRNGWDPYAPGGIEEARRGMGEFTQEEFDRYFADYLRKQQPGISTNDFEPGTNAPGNFDETDNGPIDLGNWNDWLVGILGKGKLGKLGLGKYLKKKQGEATFDDWMSGLDDNQRRYIEDWMIGLGADKNWEDRLRAGDAPWSTGQEAIDNTSRQNPRADDLVNREDDPPSPGGGPRGPRGGGGDGDGGEEAYNGPVGLPAYQGIQNNPSFLAWQPYNTNGPIQFVPGRR